MNPSLSFGPLGTSRDGAAAPCPEGYKIIPAHAQERVAVRIRAKRCGRVAHCLCRARIISQLLVDSIRRAHIGWSSNFPSGQKAIGKCAVCAAYFDDAVGPRARRSVQVRCSMRRPCSFRLVLAGYPALRGDSNPTLGFTPGVLPPGGFPPQMAGIARQARCSGDILGPLPPMVGPLGHL